MQFLVPPLPRGWEWRWVFHASDHGSVFLVSSSHPKVIQEPTESPHLRKEDAPFTQEIPRDLGALRQKLDQI